MFPTISQVLTEIEGEEIPMPPSTTSFRVDPSLAPPVNEEQVHESMRDITEEQALDRLEKMLDMPGMLQIITAEVADESFPDTDHRHFVKHDVIAIDQDERGHYRAHSAEGDWTVTPAGARSLLRHLTRVSLGSG